MTGTDQRTALRDLRRTRQRRRLGATEWFDVAYRVYLFALVGLIAVVMASDAVGGVIGNDVSGNDLLERGPSIAGIVVIGALSLGLRSGADGGPVSIETADVTYLLLAPISRRRVLLRPVSQRMRSAMFALALGCGILGQFVAREVEGSRAAWAAAGAGFGALVGATFVSSALLSHTLRMPRWAATFTGAVLLGWQGVAAWQAWQHPTNAQLGDGPAGLAGSLAFWGIRQRPIDVIAVVVVAAAAAVSLALAGRLRVEALVRRGQLVSQLRFAATVQDLRTVVLLRRQLRSEVMRSKPWGGHRRTAVRDRVPPPGARRNPPARPSLAIWARGVRSLRRLPLSRLARLVVLALAAGVFGSLATSSSLLFLLAMLAATFLLGMESIEPLSEEVDHPDLTDSYPLARGDIFTHHLVAPAGLLAALALVGAGAATALRPAQAAAAFAIAIPCVWAAAIGPIVGAVSDASPPIGSEDTTLFGSPRNSDVSVVPPEFAGFGSLATTVLPVALSALGLLPVVAMRAAPTFGTAVRTNLAAALAIAALVMWVRRRDRWGVSIRAFFNEGRQQRSAMSS